MTKTRDLAHDRRYGLPDYAATVASPISEEGHMRQKYSQISESSSPTSTTASTSSCIPTMYRVARPYQALRRESLARARRYSTAPSVAHGQAQQRTSDGIPQTQRKLNRRPPSQGKATAHTAMGNSNEDSLAGTPFRETKSGLAAHVLARIEKMAATRRAERLDAEAQQAQEAPSQPTQAQTATLLTSNDFATSAPIHDRTSHFRQNKGQSRTTRAFGGRQPGEPRTANFFNNEANNGANSALDRTSQFKQRNREQFRADRASGDRPYKGNSTFRPKAKRPPPRVSTVNFAPKRTAQTVDNSANLTATDLNPNVEAPNYPGPFAVSPDLRNIFRKPVFSQLDVALSKVSSTSPSSLKETNRILRRFAGDYSASVPNQSQALYTTPIEKLPVRTQLELAMSKSKDLDIPSRQYLTHVVSKAIGEVPSGTIV